MSGWEGGASLALSVCRAKLADTEPRSEEPNNKKKEARPRDGDRLPASLLCGDSHQGARCGNSRGLSVNQCALSRWECLQSRSIGFSWMIQLTATHTSDDPPHHAALSLHDPLPFLSTPHYTRWRRTHPPSHRKQPDRPKESAGGRRSRSFGITRPGVRPYTPVRKDEVSCAAVGEGHAAWHFAIDASDFPALKLRTRASPPCMGGMRGAPSSHPPPD